MRFTLLLSTREPFELRLAETAEMGRRTGCTESLHETEERAKSFALDQLADPPDALVGEPVAMVFLGGRLLWIGILHEGDIEWRRPIIG